MANEPQMTKEFKTELRKQIKLLKGKQGGIVINLNDLSKGTSSLVGSSDTGLQADVAMKQKIMRIYGLISEADNENGTLEQHTGRRNYKILYNKREIDTWYDLPFFGRTTSAGLSCGIDVNPETDLTNIQGPEMLLFIHGAFNEFAHEYNARANNPICCRGLSKKSAIPSIEAVKSYVDEFEIQDEYLETLYSDFFAEVLFNLGTSDKIKNIDDFYRYLKEYIEEKKSPLTTPGIMESDFGSVYVSGLMVDVLSDAADNDIQKVDFLNDPNYGVYANLAHKHGFKIDINVPWRLIFDYRRPKFAEIIAKFKKFKKVHQDNLTPHASYVSFSSRYNGFVQTLLSFYNRFIDDFPTYNSINTVSNSSSLKENFKKFLSAGCSITGSPVTTVTPELRKILRKQEKLDQYDVKGTLKVVPIKYYDWYIEIRNTERQKPLSPRLLKLLKKRSRQIYLSALNVFEPNTAVSNDFQFFIKNSNVAIQYVEYVLGSIASRYHGKSLTLQEKDPIMIYDKIREVKHVPRKVGPTWVLVKGVPTPVAERIEKRAASVTFQGQSFSY
tara:strand:- start:546 stop:2213 length:1668 start_codon:yes stop_codon:yes gene_type:complete